MMPSIKTEDLAYWFFRLNGCLCLVNFLVHHERRGQEGTDVDIMAVRFPYRRELAHSSHPMEDAPVFTPDGRIDLIIAEVKHGLCNLNGPWTKPERQNMQRVLDAIGAFQPESVDRVAYSLYEQQSYQDETYRFRLFALGMTKNHELPAPVVQLTWDDISRFIFERFNRYESYKTQHRQWDKAGQYLISLAVDNRRNQDEFVRLIINNLVA